MKSPILTLFYAILLVGLLFATSGCDSGGSEQASDECLSRTGNSMFAEVNGETICTDIGTALRTDRVGPRLSVVGLFSTSTPPASISLNVEDVGIGTFDLANANDGTDALYSDGETETGCFVGDGDGSGTVSITELSDTRVRGTFTFTGVCFDVNDNRTGDQVRVTNGAFDFVLSDAF